MSDRLCSRSLVTAGVLVMLAILPREAHALDRGLSKTEAKCAAALGKSAVKVARVAASAEAKCRETFPAGGASSCPDAVGALKVDKAVAKASLLADKKCGSTCSADADIRCIDSLACPPNGSLAQGCTAGAKNRPFEQSLLGFPGPFCADVLGESPIDPADFGACAAAIAGDAALSLAGAIYGSLDAASAPSKSASSCLAAISKTARKIAATAAKSSAKCLDAVNAGKLLSSRSACLALDPKAAAKVAKLEAKLFDAIDQSCGAGELAEIDLCGAGIGGIADPESAKSCIVQAAREAAASSEPPSDRQYVARSIVEAAYPPSPVCGDGAANQLPTPRNHLGEECDGDDDDACPGECLPPGDIFECTCGNIPRLRYLQDGSASDRDAGWEAGVQDSVMPDNTSYTVTLSGCDCADFTGAQCTGGSTDPVCEIEGRLAPFCSWDSTLSVGCDGFGDGDGRQEDEDCRICDVYSANAGASCSGESDCQARCYDASGTPNGVCSSQSDCAAGERCRGRCDDTVECVEIIPGAANPIVGGGAGACVSETFLTNSTGSVNLETGEHSIELAFNAIQYLAESLAKPCPVCGGYCDAGTRAYEVCEGRCSDGAGGGSEDACRFDTDCPVGESCDGSATPDCPGGACVLDLICASPPGLSNPNSGASCEIDAEHPYFGTLSADCTPSPGLNVSGAGTVQAFHTPGATTEPILKTASVPCTGLGFELYDCHCPQIGGIETRPNSCAQACDAGVNAGLPCATNGQPSGAATTCSGGPNAGRVCDEDADCPGAACDSNPSHCEGDPSFEFAPCATNAECGVGACVDACPGGRCVPLCLPVPGDPGDGYCAAGPDIYRCGGGRYSGTSCSASAIGAGCSATCSVSGTPCTSIGDCPTGEACEGACPSHADCEAGADGLMGTIDDLYGAGACAQKVRECIEDVVSLEGGTTLNGLGDMNDVVDVAFWCASASPSQAVNIVGGLPGPAKERRRGTYVISVPSIP